MILINDFKKEPEELIQAEVQACERVIRSGWYILGQEVKTFEEAWAKLCKVPHSVGVANGMDAIEIGLRALNIGAGDEVITTPVTAFATVLAILRAGATPVLADIDPETALLDLKSVERCLTKKTKAVLLVHLYGQVRAMGEWQKFCENRKIHLLEDCAQAHLAAANGKVAGTFGDWGAYSFYPTKNLGAIGDGGIFITSSDAVASKARVLRNYGQKDRYHHVELGLNSRLDELQAAILSERLRWLEVFTERRREIAEKYQAQMKNSTVQLLARPQARENHVYHLFVARTPERERLSAFLKTKGVETLIHYPVAVHAQSPCTDIRRDPQGLPAADRFVAECISLPCHPQMSDREVDQVIEAVHAFR